MPRGDEQNRIGAGAGERIPSTNNSGNVNVNVADEGNSSSVARPLPPLYLGGLRLETPVILAPMAGVTDPPFRRLCRESGEAGIKAVGAFAAAENHDAACVARAGLFVTEMITSRALVEKNPKTELMIKPESGDPVRSVQIYGVHPQTVGKAIEILIDQGIADHIDLNFGCPAAKVTRRGGGAALPWKRDLFAAIVKEAVQAAERASKRQISGRRTHLDWPVPVTVKTRIGIDQDHLTYLEAGQIAQNAGIAGICLHARTLAEYYSGNASWDHIARIREKINIAVIGNGDVFSAEDAQRMVEQTGCQGVEIGRGAQGAPWIFTELAAWAHGGKAQVKPNLGQVAQLILRHADLLAAHQGQEHGLRELRKHITWYLRGYPVGGVARNRLAQVKTLGELKELLGDLDWEAPFGKDTAGARGRAGGEKRPRLPENWLASQELLPADRALIHLAEDDISGG